MAHHRPPMRRACGEEEAKEVSHHGTSPSTSHEEGRWEEEENEVSLKG